MPMSRSERTGGRVALSVTTLGVLAVGAFLLCGIPGGTPVRAQVRGEFVPTFPTSTRVKQQVERLDRLAAQKLWDQWLQTYQQLVNEGAEQVLERDDEFLVGVRHHCHQLLAGLPAETRQRYRALYDAEAARLYQRAEAARDEAAMREVYSRYRFTASGPRALLWLAGAALDDGRPELARIAYRRAVRETGVDATTLLRYALAAGAAGRREEAAGALERVRREFAGQAATVAGEQLPAPAAAERVAAALRELPAPATSGAGWRRFAGNDGTRRMAAGPSGELVRLWDYRHPTGTGPTSTRVSYGSISFSSARSRFAFLSFPIAGEQLAWVQGPRNISAVDLATGTAVWTATGFTLSREENPQENNNPRTGGVWYPSGRPTQAAPLLDGSRVITRMPLAVGDREGTRWPADFALVALDARSGHILWRRLAGGEPRGMFYNIPAVHAGTLITGSATHKGGITEFSATALDAATGEPLWTTYLGAGSDPLGAADGSPAAFTEGTVWIESTLYTLNALDLLTGELRLIYRYRPGRRESIRGGFNTAPAVINEPISLIAAGETGPVVFAPRWGTDVVALDASTGRLLWSAPKGGGAGATGVLFGADNHRVYITGEHLQALNLADGGREWTWEPEGAAADLGFAALAGDRIYAPINGRIHVRAAADGRDLGILNPSGGLGETVGFSSVVVVGERVLLCTPTGVTAFGRPPDGK